jgi:uncharacterized membrane protein YfcA
VILSADLIPHALAMLATGLLGGFLAGLLGVGGGIVVVPVLHQILTMLGFESGLAMQVSVGTSLATIIPISIVSARNHYKRGGIDLDLARQWAPWIAAGSVVGGFVAAYVRGSALAAVFAAIAFIVAAWMGLNRSGRAVFSGLPKGGAMVATSGGIGLFATLMGIGGGTLSVPVRAACGYPMRRAVGTGAFFGLFIAMPGTIPFCLIGLDVAGRPPLSLGFVNLPGFILIAPISMLAAPWGARVAHAIPPRALQVSFAVFLLLTAIKFALVVL